MADKIHIGKNGPAKCPAKKQCRLKNDDGTPATHYDNWADAGKAFDKQMEGKYGKFASIESGGEEPSTKPNPKSTPKHKAVSEKPKATFEVPKINEVEGYMGSSGWVGSKVTPGYTPLPEVAKNIRQDLKDAESAGWLPSDLKYSVTTRDNSINLEVLNMPSDNQVYDEETDHYGRVIRTLKPQYKELENKLSMIHDSYNHDSSNSMVDYFNRGYYGKVSLLDDREKALNTSLKLENSILAKVRKAKREGEDVSKLIESEGFRKSLDSYYEASKVYGSHSYGESRDGGEAYAKKEKAYILRQIERIKK